MKGSTAQTGLIHLYSGDGKGKTTAAMGLALRAVGNGLPVVIVQFLKDGSSGECRVLRELPGVTIHAANPCGKFSFQMSGAERRQTTEAVTALFRQVTQSPPSPGLFILDEVCGALTNGFLSEAELLDFLKGKPPALEVVLTGRSPCEALCALADYHSEIRKRRHPYEKGVPARPGIER